MNFEALLNTLLELFTTIGLKLLYAALVFFVGLKLVKWLRKTLPVFPFMEKLDEGVRGFLISTLSVALYVLLGVTVAMLLGVPTASFIAALASCMAAIGLAMQGSLSNVAGGMMLLIFKPFRIGDYISCPDVNTDGFVQQISVVYTILRTYDGIEVTVPNGTLMNSVIKNIGAAKTRRIDLTFRTDLSCPLEKTEAILHATVDADERILRDPEPSIVLFEITDSAIVYGVRVWCPGSEYWNVRFALNRAVKLAFDENGVGIPHQQVDVHMQDTPET